MINRKPQAHTVVTKGLDDEEAAHLREALANVAEVATASLAGNGFPNYTPATNPYLTFVSSVSGVADPERVRDLLYNAIWWLEQKEVDLDPSQEPTVS
jgi:hypothetical protein